MNENLSEEEDLLASSSKASFFFNNESQETGSRSDLLQTDEEAENFDNPEMLDRSNEEPERNEQSINENNESSQVFIDKKQNQSDDENISSLEFYQSPIPKQENNLVSPIISSTFDKKKLLASPISPNNLTGTESTLIKNQDSFDSFEIDGDPLASQTPSRHSINTSSDPLKTPPDSSVQTDDEINGIIKEKNKLAYGSVSNELYSDNLTNSFQQEE